MLVPVDGRPLVANVVDTAARLPRAVVVVVVGHQGDEVKRALRRRFPEQPLRFVTQKQQRGTGHAVATAMRAVRGKTGDVLILSGDVPLIQRRTLTRLRRLRQERGADLTLLTMTLTEPGRYGRVVRRGSQVEQVVEYLDAPDEVRALREVNAGIYCAELSFLRRALRQLGSDNAQGEVYLTDLVALAAAGRGAAAQSCDPSEVQGINTWAEQAALEQVVRQRVAARLMKGGVALQAPERLIAHSRVRVGPDSVLGPDVTLAGDTRIGRDCRVETGAQLRDCRLGPRVRVRPYCVLEGVSLRADAEVGPFAHLSGAAPDTLPEGIQPYDSSHPTNPRTAANRRSSRRSPTKDKGRPTKGKGRPTKGKGRPTQGKGRPTQGKGRPTKGKGKE